MKLFVIGIDGATYNVIRPLVAAGKLPNIARMMAEGSSARLTSTIPPLSPVAWTSITTGALPAVHGIIDFLGYDKAAKRSFLFDASHRRVDPLWSLAGKVGKRSCVVNVPLTYPVDKVNGFMLSGLGTPPTNDGLAHPPELFAEMKKAIGGYAIDIVLQENQDDEKIANALQQVMAGRHKCFDFLLANEAWDLFFFVFTNTDRAQHFFWREHEEGSGPLAGVISECYEQADLAVGKAMARAEAEGGVVMIVSDHGFGPLKNSFSLSKWLHAKGWLIPSEAPVREGALKGMIKKYLPRRLINLLIRTIFKERWKFSGPSADLNQWINWEKTKVFSHKRIDTVYLFLNDATVSEPAQRTALIEEVRGALLDITDPRSGKKIMLDVLDGQQIFGAGNALTPDLVLISAAGYNFSFDRGDLELKDPFVGIPRLWSGNHETEGVFMAWGNHISAGRDCGVVSIIDILPTMCYAMDLAIPQWAKGQVIRHAFAEDFLREHEERRDHSSGGDTQARTSAGAMSEEESEDVVKRLKALGYL